MGLVHNITRGGQTNIHFITMLRQVLKVSILCSLLVGLIFYSTKTYNEVPKAYWQSYMKYYSHELNPFLLFVIEDKTTLHRLPQVLKRVAKVNYTLKKNSLYGIKAFLASFSLILLSWLIIGTRQRQKKHNRGNCQQRFKTDPLLRISTV
ncbi:MAG: hypothetical protein BGO76_04445 [Caedibacter sp. 38-128]|nr:MAG: hypothetical protein BGO76_04445 [Caedibacter sp. 38-128]